MDTYEGVPDHELWHRAAGRDGAAFGKLFERHSRAVYNHCFRRTGKWSDAEELTAAVFAEAWRLRRRTKLDSDDILPWLLAVANNLIRNQSRSLARHQKFLMKLPAPADVADFGDEAARRLDSERQMAEVLAVVSSLRVEEQEVLSLCDWAELDYAQAATALGIPVGTVRSRLSRARAHLRQRLTTDNRSSQVVLWRVPL